MRRLDTTMTRRPQMLLAPLALLALGVGLWAGLLRLGWRLPTPQAGLAALHGPLMLAGFFGVVIGLERAVALKRAWTYAAPLLTGLGGLLLLVGVPGRAGPLLITLGSIGLVAVFALILRQHPALHTWVMALGALAWLVGNALWLAGRPLFSVVLCWAGFLVLTIAGERLELGRLLQLSPRVRAVFGLIVALLLAGLVVAGFNFDLGARVSGAACLALALWLLRYDIARRTVRKTGLTRFIAVCLLSGFVWLAVGGGIGLIYGGIPAGPIYDAFLHTLFVGFVFAMIFGHAPIIIPAVLGAPLAFMRSFYIHLSLLHLSLGLRVVGDLGGLAQVRLWGGMLNVCAIVLFLIMTVVAARRAGSAAKGAQLRPQALHH